MIIIRPAEITDGILTSNVTETYSAWSSVTAYTSASAPVTYNQSVYQAIANTTNNNPETDPAAATYWTRIEPMNKWAMFDTQTSTVSTRASNITVTVQPSGTADSVALFYVSAAAVNVTVSDGVDEYYNEDFSLTDNSGIEDWYFYFFEPIVRKTEFYVSGLPNLYNPEITVTTTGTGTVEIGHCVVGFSRDLGGTAYGAQVGFTDYSKIEVDALGVPESITPRAFVRSNRFTVWVEAARVDYVINLLASYRATPVAVIGASEYTSTFGFGLLKAGYMAISYPSHSVIDIELQGF